MMPNEEGRKDNRSIIDQKERKKILKDMDIWNGARIRWQGIYTWIARFFLKSASAWDWKSAAPIVDVAAIMQ
jgi:hypothetical protein